MIVSAGSRLGPYQLVAPIGAGGMGEVWRATDTRLGRNVAIKILPAEFALSETLRLRFDREAKVISQLNHPNICTLYDVGENYLVMELLEGESLAGRVARGALPIPETLKIGAQIAEALDRAHRAGIVHRDLKPGNVMLTKSGAKLLDFGLAKGATIDVSADGATQQKPLTQEGTILGTFQYMAPEQLEGLEADARTDIFALGAVLYEMATGRRAFSGTSKTSLIAAIVSGEPIPISQIQPLTPPAFEHVVRKCLAKDPEARWQSAFDVAEELRWIGESGSSAAVAAPARRRSWERVAWGVALAAAIAIAGWLAMRKPPVPPRIETSIVAPEGVMFSNVAGSFALSPDGSKLAFLGRRADSPTQIWIRALSSSSARPLPGTENAQWPTWSPDGRFLAFIAGAKLHKIGVEGGSPEVLADTSGRIFGMTWLYDGSILIADVNITRIADGKRTPLIGGGATQVLSAPYALPDGRHFLYSAFRGSEPDALIVATVDGKERKRLLPGIYSNSAYMSPGWLLFSREGDLRAQRFDLRTLQLSGDAVRVIDRVQYDADAKAALFTLSRDGTLLYAEGEGAGKTQMTWLSREGEEIGTVAPPGMYFSPRLSHDGKRVAVDISDNQTAKGDIWTFDLARNTSTRVTFDAVNESAPIWSPDDRQLAYFSEKLGQFVLFRRASSGGGTDEVLFANDKFKVPLEFSPDGQWLAFVTSNANELQFDIMLLNLATKKVSPLVNTPFKEMALAFAPDGKWIAFESDETGTAEVYVQSFPAAGGKVIVSRGGGHAPQWRGNGRELYYLSPDGKMMAVPIAYQPQFDAGLPEALFANVVVRDVPTSRQFEVSADGSRFLLNRVVSDGQRPLTMVQNWAVGLGGR